MAVICWETYAAPAQLCGWWARVVFEAISRLMGFLLVCMGVEFIFNGILEIVNTYH
ncbi:MarC family protein [Shigella flexneri]